MTLTRIFIYSAGNIGVFFLYRHERCSEFSPLLHFLFPVLSTLSLLWVAYHSVVPLPERPLRYAPILVGTWLGCRPGGAVDRAQGLQHAAPASGFRERKPCKCG